MARRRSKTRLKRTVLAAIFVLFLVFAVACTVIYFTCQDKIWYRDFRIKIEAFLDKAGFDVYGRYDRETPVVASGDLSFHFLELGNGNTGDCIYIKAGDNDIRIDAGSRANSIDAIQSYVDVYCTDGVLEYVIATHADQDHIAAFAGNKTYDSVFDLYKCETIIDFPLTNKDTTVYKNYVEKRDDEVENDGAVHYNALQCYNETDGARRTYDLGDDISMSVLYNYFYEHESADENNYSVCLLFSHGERYFLFTGDLEKKGEEYLVQYNELPKVELFKAGHHGSKTSSNDCLLSVIQPKIVCVCCCAGSVEYTQNLPNTFPTQEFIDRVSKYTDKVYVTTMMDVVFSSEKDKYVDDGEYKLMNGNIVVASETQSVTVNCSNNNTLLKDTEWFKKNRNTPPEWNVA